MSKNNTPDTNIVLIIEVEGLIGQIGEKWDKIDYNNNQSQFRALHEARVGLMDFEKTVKGLRDSFEG